jgi:hypothetical protein
MSVEAVVETIARFLPLATLLLTSGSSFLFTGFPLALAVMIMKSQTQGPTVYL